MARIFLVYNFTIQDTKKVSSIEEFKNRKYRYQMSEYSVEIERLVLRLENLLVEGASLEPTLLERIRRNIEKFPEMEQKDNSEVYTWWNDLNNDFVRLNQNYQDYIRDLNSVKAEEMMRTKEFLVFKDRLIEYLRNFIKGLQRNAGVIEESLQSLDTELREKVFRKIIEFEILIPRMDTEITEKMLEQKIRGRFQSIYDWFAGAGDQETSGGAQRPHPRRGGGAGSAHHHRFRQSGSGGCRGGAGGVQQHLHARVHQR